MGEKVSWYCAAALATVLLLRCFAGRWGTTESAAANGGDELMMMMMGRVNVVVPPFERRQCEEIYVVREGETLQTISGKCGDPFIVEENPHIHDPDDVYPGLVIKITPFIYT
ncbi:PREDICTED: uncharacterized protein LOC109155155 [Ipomoea nil]|uniref:uncharacterized protein LOC109155155 n=1 Tax=Ipomoea nil TaxID=35883 RepID=UPI00090189DD|nr:PREDICTED: uncharacterized protein LOC109155155 [Ipomoea nil]